MFKKMRARLAKRQLRKTLFPKLRFYLGRTPSGKSMRSSPYIFMIGFNKTGTKSLSNLFAKSGYPVVHWDHNELVSKMLENMAAKRKLLAGYDRSFKVFSDLILSSEEEIVEGNSFYRTLENDYPNSVFILNNRNTENWLTSRTNHAHGTFLKRQLGILGSGSVEDAHELWRNQKLTHEREVREHFKDKPEKFLELDIESQDVVDTLSKFMGETYKPEHWGQIGRSWKTPQKRSSD